MTVSSTRAQARTCDCPACESDNGGLSFCAPCRFHDCTADKARCGGDLATDGGQVIDKLVIEHMPDDFSNPSFRTAYRKGALAARHGEPRDSCPYPDHRQETGRLTFSRAFRKEWYRGFDREQERRRP